MLNHVLHNKEGLKVAEIVNDMSEVNIDAALVRDGAAALSRTDEKLVAMSNGCWITCCPIFPTLILNRWTAKRSSEPSIRRANG